MKQNVEQKISQLLNQGFSANVGQLMNQLSDIVKGIFLYAFVAVLIYAIGTYVLSFIVDFIIPMPAIDAEELEALMESGNQDEIVQFYSEYLSSGNLYKSSFLNNILSVVLYPIIYSIFIMAYKYDHNQKVSFDDIFVFYKNGKFLNLFAVTLIIQFLSTLGIMLCVLPGIILYFAWVLAIPLVIFADADIKEAITKSLQIAFKDFGSFVIFGLLVVGISILAAVLGMLMCCVGLIITLPAFYIIMIVLIYLLYKQVIGFSDNDPIHQESKDDIYSNNPYMK